MDQTGTFHRYVEPVEETEIRNLIRSWNQRARKEGDLTVKFVFLWFCLNACLAFESEEDLDAEMIKWLTSGSSTGSRLRSSFEAATSSEVFRGYLRTLADMSPINSTGRRKRSISIDSEEDFNGLVRGLYQVRCNLFHGGKDPKNPRDDKLVRTCARILEKWVGNVIATWK